MCSQLLLQTCAKACALLTQVRFHYFCSTSILNDSLRQPRRVRETEVTMTSEKEIRQPKQKAVVVGGSIAGLSCAHALLAAGWEVVVIEKSAGSITGSPTGAGVGLDPLSCTIIQSWLKDSEALSKVTLPLTIDQSQAVDGEKKISWTLTRDEKYNFKAAHWAHLHALLASALPSDIFLWGHMFLSISNAGEKGSVTVKAKVLQTGAIIEISGDLLVAADGSLSSIRQAFLPDLKLRYAGYCAWRGILDFSENEDSDTIRGIRKAYPDLGNGVYFDLGEDTHCVLYELLGKRMNWVWYVNQPEPETKGSSLTMKASEDIIKKMHLEAEKVWVPELARLIRETEPFLNVIYDSDPLERIFWDKVVLVGDAAHPITPHSSRSTNGSILDAAVLGKCLQKNRGLENLHVALSEYQSMRLPVMAKQVLHSRHVGQIRQGLARAGDEPFDPKKASGEDCPEFKQRNTPFFSHVPELLDLS